MKKYWNSYGQLVTEDELHTGQHAAQVYRDADLRLSNSGSPATNERLHRRWPMLIDAINAQSAAFRLLTPAQRAADLASIEADLVFISLGL